MSKSAKLVAGLVLGIVPALLILIAGHDKLSLRERSLLVCMYWILLAVIVHLSR